MRDVRVFISSPGDAAFERQRTICILERLNGEFAGIARFVPIRWEDELYKAHATFQAQIPEAAACDVVVAIFRARLGTPLPSDFAAMENGETYPSGTAYEVLTAIAARQHQDLPDVYVFRNPTPPSVSLEDPAREKIEEQWRQLKAFFDRWFRTPEGQFKAAFQPFSSTDQFESLAEKALRQWIDEHLPEGRTFVWSIAQKGSPFRGLEPFGAKHAPVFFGRTRETAKAIDALKDAAERGTPFLLLLGPSGAGKSSLARAGLVPRLTAPGAVPNVDVWRVAVMRPSEGASPIAALAARLFDGPDDIKEEERGQPFALPELAEGDYPNSEKLAAALAHDDDSAVQPILRAIDKVAEATRKRDGYDRPVTARLLLVVDQLDDHFAMTVPDGARAAFARLLVRLAATMQVWIVGTLRDELYSAFQKEVALRDLKERGVSLDVRSPGPVELADLVRGPAEAAGLGFEKDAATGETLDERLLSDAERGDLLPLLQFTLNRLFEAREGARLAFAAYAALGGIEGAVDKEAERAVGSLPQDVQARLGRLIRQLAAPSQGASAAGGLDIRPAPLAVAEIDAPSRQLVAALVDARILLTSAAQGTPPMLRLAHARVLESWRRAKIITGESADFFRIRAEVEEQFRRWSAAKERSDLLVPSGLPLAEAESIAKRFREELPETVQKFIALSGRKARAFQRRIAAAAVLFFGLAVAAAFFGLESRRAQNQAEARLAAAKKAVTGLVVDVAQGLQNVEGMRAESVRKILETAGQTVTDLLASAPDDKDLQRIEAAKLVKFGDVYAKTGSPGALESYEKALSISRKLAAADPRNANLQRDISVSLNRIGDAKLRSGDANAALAAYEEGLAIVRRLAATDPDSEDWRRDLSISLDRIGEVKLRRGDAAGALKAYEEGLAIRRALAAAAPGNANVQRAVFISLNNIGTIRVRNGDAEGALKAYEEGLAITRKLAAADPGNTDRQRDVSVSLDRIGDVKLRSGDAAGALKPYKEGLAIARTLASSDPGNADLQRDIAVGLNKIGDARLISGDAEGALNAYEESLAIGRKLADTNPGNTQWLRDVSVSLDRIGDIKRRRGDLASALKAYEEALAFRQKLTATDPTNADWRRDISVSLGRIGDIKFGSGDAEGALKAYEESLAIRQKLTATDPTNADWRRDVAVTLTKIGDAKTRSGDAVGALKAYEEGLAISRTFAAADPGNTDRQRDVAINLTRIGDVKLGSGDAAGALKAYEEGLDIRRKLASSLSPETKTVYIELVGSDLKIAQVEPDAGRRKAALEDALQILRALDAKGLLSGDQKKWPAVIESELTK